MSDEHTFVSPSAFSRRAVVSYWRKYVHEVLVNRLRGLSLPRKSVVRLTDRPDMTLDVYRGRKTTMQQQQKLCRSGKGGINVSFQIVIEFRQEELNDANSKSHWLIYKAIFSLYCFSKSMF